MVLDCIPCIVGSFQKLLNTGVLPEKDKEPAMRRLLRYLAEADYRTSPPVLGRGMHRMIREMLHNPDPYKAVKDEYNARLLELYPEFREKVNAADDPFDAAMRLAIAGNVIDYGPNTQLNLKENIEKVSKAPLAVDDSAILKKEIAESGSMLYVGDNCGEIVLDTLFLETMQHPNVHFAVRASAVINDATMEDALTVGVDRFAKILTTGDDSPGAVWETASEEFRRIFNEADVVIAKGQGNYEGLMEVTRVYYSLLVVKCDYIGGHVGAKKGEYIVKRNNG